MVSVTKESNAMTVGDSNETRPSDRVVAAVAEREGTDPTELTQPLDEVIDPEALNHLFADRTSGGQRPGGRVIFWYYGYTVTVDDDGTVSLESE